MIKVDSLDEMFAVLLQKMDPSTGRNRMEEIQIEEMKQYRMKLMKQHKES